MKTLPQYGSAMIATNLLMLIFSLKGKKTLLQVIRQLPNLGKTCNNVTNYTTGSEIEWMSLQMHYTQ